MLRFWGRAEKKMGFFAAAAHMLFGRDARRSSSKKAACSVAESCFFERVKKAEKRNCAALKERKTAREERFLKQSKRRNVERSAKGERALNQKREEKRAEKQQKRRRVRRGLCRAAVLAAIVLFVWKAPAWAAEQLQENFYLEWLSPNRSQWEGILRLWNVYGEGERFDGDLLKETVRLFERRNRGAFVEYVTLPASEVEERIALRGAPDLWIVPEGLRQEQEGDALLVLPQKEDKNVLTEEFEFDPGQTAQPEETQAEGRRFFLWNRTKGEAAEAAAAFCALLAQRTAALWKTP